MDNKKKENETENKETKKVNPLPILLGSHALLEGGFMLTMQSRRDMTLHFYNGDVGRSTTYATTLASFSNMLSIYLSPKFGYVCDTYGRKPLILAAHVANSICSFMFLLKPNLITLTILKVFASMAFSGNSIGEDAAISDNFSGKELATAKSRVGLVMGGSAIIFSPLGGYLTAMSLQLTELSAFILSTIGAIFVYSQFPGDFKTSKKKIKEKGEDNIHTHKKKEAASIFSFTKLFTNGSKLSLTTLAYVCQTCCDYSFEVDQMFYRQSIQIPPQQLGMLFSLRGICVLIGGSLIKPGLKLFGTFNYITFLNVFASIYLYIKSYSRSITNLYFMLPFYAMSPLFVRTSPISSLFTKYGKEAGLKGGELVAAYDNFNSIIMLFIPIMYARIYGATRDGTFARVGIAFLAACQCLMMYVRRLDKDD